VVARPKRSGADRSLRVGAVPAEADSPAWPRAPLGRGDGSRGRRPRRRRGKRSRHTPASRRTVTAGFTDKPPPRLTCRRRMGRRPGAEHCAGAAAHARRTRSPTSTTGTYPASRQPKRPPEVVDLGGRCCPPCCHRRADRARLPTRSCEDFAGQCRASMATASRASWRRM